MRGGWGRGEAEWRNGADKRDYGGVAWEEGRGERRRGGREAEGRETVRGHAKSGCRTSSIFVVGF